MSFVVFVTLLTEAKVVTVKAIVVEMACCDRLEATVTSEPAIHTLLGGESIGLFDSGLFVIFLDFCFHSVWVFFFIVLVGAILVLTNVFSTLKKFSCFVLVFNFISFFENVFLFNSLVISVTEIFAHCFII